MFVRTFALLLGLSTAVGCTAPTEDLGDELGESEDALTPRALRKRTALDRVRVLDAEEGSVRVDYEPEGYEKKTSVEYEPVKFEGSANHKFVSVAGKFPSVATVVVTDEDFKVLAVERTKTSAAGVAEARIRVPSGKGGRLVLIRDPKWNKPMSFDVNVAR